MNPSARNIRTLFVCNNTTRQMMSQLIAYEPLMLFVEEIIDYSLRQNNLLNWNPAMNLEYLRLQHADKRYFDDRIGEAIGHSCTERAAINSALKLGFDENSWLTLDPENARERLIEYLGLMLNHDQVNIDLAVFQLFSFGCYVGRAAMKRRLNGLTNEVVQALVRTCCVHFPYEKQYVEFLTYAESYNSAHHGMHSQHDERF
ncbi:hypothetical protein AVEN_161703-1 [Araneus ventricosus]|uniref:Uncharacterized protein n=1 Tax=Araneus ventricosus TaxID=182803 RepID=A0A4Y2KCS9_ARAVE|nr:hypothetical protein AVEN_161703-1 [Araneus ventricosus]